MKVKVISESNDGQKYECILNVEDYTEQSVNNIFDIEIQNINGQDWSCYGYKVISFSKVNN